MSSNACSSSASSWFRHALGQHQACQHRRNCRHLLPGAAFQQRLLGTVLQDLPTAQLSARPAQPGSATRAVSPERHASHRTRRLAAHLPCLSDLHRCRVSPRLLHRRLPWVCAELGLDALGRAEVREGRVDRLPEGQDCHGLSRRSRHLGTARDRLQLREDEDPAAHSHRTAWEPECASVAHTIALRALRPEGGCLPTAPPTMTATVGPAAGGGGMGVVSGGALVL
eukprot:653743-Rhodomonas_salina.1